MRRLPFTGTPNFRDLGGYTTEDGRQVKWGHLYRSGQLSRLTEQDQQLLHSLQLDLICDFRRREEQTRDPSRLPVPEPRRISLSITPGSSERFFSEATEYNVDRQVMTEFMVGVNHELALGQASQYCTMFSFLVQERPIRMLFHCAAGKDRTGFAAAIILLALGVPREQVMEDYLLTAKYFLPQQELKRMCRKYGIELPEETIRPVLEVHPEYLQGAFDAIDGKYDSVGHYLEEVLGVDRVKRERLRSHYLE